MTNYVITKTTMQVNSNLLEEISKLLDAKLKPLDKRLSNVEKQIPENFWEEFDRRLDAKLDEKLDAKFTEKLAPIEKRLDKLEKKVDNVVKWTQRQDTYIEQEITLAVFDHLKLTKMGYFVVQPPTSVVNKVFKNESGLTKTDFDGIVFLTNSKEYADYFKGGGSFPKKDPNAEAYIVITEAKQHVTKAKFDKKVQQRQSIREHKSHVPAFNLCKDEIGLYIGGSYFDPEVCKQFDDFGKKEELVGFVELNGNRFSVKDKANGFCEFTYGGGKKRRT